MLYINLIIIVFICFFLELFIIYLGLEKFLEMNGMCCLEYSLEKFFLV